MTGTAADTAATAATGAPVELTLADHIENLGLDAAKGKTLEELIKLDDEVLGFEKEFEKELAALQKKFEDKWNPLLKERTTILVPTEEAKQGTPALKNFWLTALKRSPEFEDMIEEHDEPVLAALKDITFEYMDDEGKTGWKLHFHFAENDFFTDKIITKHYVTAPTSKWDSALEYKSIKVLAPIDWKAKMNVTVELKGKKVKGGGKKKQKQKNKVEEVPRRSFFRGFFTDLGEGCELPERPKDSDEEEESEDEDEEFDIMEMLLNDDEEMSTSLRDNIIPHAVRYFTGEACEEDDEDDDDEDDDDDDDDEDDDDEDDDDEDDDDDDDDDSPAGKKGKGKGKGGEECKQQ